jgi:hypothetical protein
MPETAPQIGTKGNTARHAHSGIVWHRICVDPMFDQGCVGRRMGTFPRSHALSPDAEEWIKVRLRRCIGNPVNVFLSVKNRTNRMFQQSGRKQKMMRRTWHVNANDASLGEMAGREMDE